MNYVLNSFNGGEFSPFTLSRPELQKYKDSCKELTNFHLLPMGGAYRRAGSLYLGASADSGNDRESRLIGFQFNVNEGLVVELYNLGLRFWKDGSVISVAGTKTTPYLESELFDIQTAQANDVVYFTHPNHPVYKLSRNSDTDWDWEEVVFDSYPFRDENTSTTTLTAAATTGTGVNVTSSASLFDANHVGSRWKIGHRVAANVQTDRPIEYLSGISTGTPVANSYTAGDFAYLSINSGTEILYFECIADYDHTTDYVSGDDSFSDYPSFFTLGIEVFAPIDIYGSWTIKTGGSTTSSYEVQESDDGGTTWVTRNTLTSVYESPETFTIIGEVPSVSYQLRVMLISTGFTGETVETGSINFTVDSYVRFGEFEVTAYNSATSIDVTVITEIAETTATTEWREGSWSDFRGYPRAISFFEKRLIFGGNQSQSQTLWMSKIDDIENFDRGQADDDDAIEVSLYSQSYESINWIASQRNLLIGTTGGEWLMKSSSDSKSITPSTIRAVSQSGYGGEAFQALILGSDIFYVQRGSRVLRAMQYSFQQDAFQSSDMTILAEHITESGIKQVGVQKNRFQTVWLLRNDGTLLSMVYEPKQQVYGWSKHQTDGDIESFCIISNANQEDDEIWLSVKRTIDGSDVRYVERLAVDNWRTQETATTSNSNQSNLVFTDCTHVYSGSATTTITGLSALEGEEVQIIADGGTVPNQTVTSGQITLDDAAELVYVGLPYNSVLETASFEWVSTMGSTQGQTKRITKAEVKVYQSLMFDVQLDDGTWQTIDFRESTDDSEIAPPLKSGVYDIRIQGNHTKEPRVKLRQSLPLPLCLLSISARATAKGQ